MSLPANSLGGGLLGQLGAGLLGSPPTSQTSNVSGNTSSDTNTSSSANNASQGTTAQTTNPNLPDWYSSFLQSMPQQFQSQLNYANAPTIGQPQIASYLQGVNSQYGQGQQQVLSQLAKSGALNSGRAASTLTGMQLGKMNNIDNYLANVPVVNKQTSLQYGSPILSAMSNFKIPYGQTSTGSNFNNSWANNYGYSASNSSTNQNTKTKNSGSGLFGAIGL